MHKKNFIFFDFGVKIGGWCNITGSGAKIGSGAKNRVLVQKIESSYKMRLSFMCLERSKNVNIQ